MDEVRGKGEEVRGKGGEDGWTSASCRRYDADAKRRRRVGRGKPHVQPRRGLTWGSPYKHGHEPRRGSVVIVNVGIDIVVSKSGVYGGEQSLQLSTDNEQNLCNLAHCWLLCSVCPHLDASVKVGLTECRKLSKLASW